MEETEFADRRDQKLLVSKEDSPTCACFHRHRMLLDNMADMLCTNRTSHAGFRIMDACLILVDSTKEPVAVRLTA